MRRNQTTFLRRTGAFAAGAAALIALSLGIAGCNENSGSGAGTAPAQGGQSAAPAAATTPAAAANEAPVRKERYVIAVIPKSQSNPVYLAARAGAEAAARDLAATRNVAMEIRWTAPAEDDAARQSELIGEAVTLGVDGMALSVSDPLTSTAAIDAAVAKGIKVVTFDADAPDSKRFAHYGIDDKQAGAMVVNRLVEIMGGRGRVAVLSGNRASDNIRARVIGAATALRDHPEIEFIGAFDHDETSAGARAAMAHAHQEHGPIDGWALVGGWPLYQSAELEGVPEEVTIVSMDPLPPALDHAQAGRVQAFVAQPYYDWGYRSVMVLFDRLHDGKSPAQAVTAAELEVITAGEVDAYRSKWRSWVGDSSGNGG